MKARTGSRLAWSLCAVSIAGIVAALVLGLRNDSLGGGEAIGVPLAFSMATGYGIVGALVASRHRRNPIGWMFLAAGLGLVLEILSSEYAIYGLRTRPGSVPATTATAWFANWVIVPTIATVPMTLLLFPSGRVPSPRWRPVLWLMIGAGVVTTLGIILSPGTLSPQPGIRVRNPTGVEALGGGVAASVILVAGLVLLAGALASVVALVLRYRRSIGDERRQVRLLAFVAIAGALLLLATLASGFLGGAGAVNDAFFVAFATTLTLGIPVASGVAILRHRLYEVDIVIRRALVYGVLAALVTALYLLVAVGIPALVFGVGEGVGARDLIPFAGAALLALAFQPLRARARRLANRLVYGKRATPYEVLSEFSDRAGGVISTEDVLPRMAELIVSGTGASRAEVWLRVGPALRREAVSPPDAPVEGAGVVSTDGAALPALPGVTTAIPVTHRGGLLGALAVAMPPSEPLDPTQEKLLRDLASQAGLVLRNVGLIEELRASRKRLVEAQDAERRRLERDIHDGAQQQLVALAVKLRLARNFAAKDAAKAEALLDDLQAESQAALENLRDLARGIYPPLLADQGLASALEAQARKSPLPVTVESDGIARYPQEVEAAVYFCCLEALQNVAKYANASGATVRLWREGGQVAFEVADDGTGFDPASTPSGSGLQNMSDRLEALGGLLEVRSAPGGGTRVEGRIPV